MFSTSLYCLHHAMHRVVEDARIILQVSMIINVSVLEMNLYKAFE
jgi:hypothetical protein